MSPDFLPEGSDSSDSEKSKLSSDSDNADESPAKSKHGTKGNKASLASSSQKRRPVDEDRVSPTPPPTRKAKAKGRELPVPIDDEDADDGQHVVDVDPDADAGYPLMPGRLPQEAICKAIALGEKTVAEAMKIGKEYGKPVHTILIEAGLAVKAVQAENAWNMYQVWYKTMHPKSLNGEYHQDALNI